MLSCFNSRTPGGVRQTGLSSLLEIRTFQFTHPGRGATSWPFYDGDGVHVSIHAPREGCDPAVPIASPNASKFQFTHPGRGATSWDITGWRPRSWFQFTHPGRGATATGDAYTTRYDVSIHAPREGCDLATCVSKIASRSFNSRTPGGVRHEDYRNYTINFLFQFTHPGRGATHLRASGQRLFPCFNSRTPGGVRPVWFPCRTCRC